MQPLDVKAITDSLKQTISNIENATKSAEGTASLLSRELKKNPQAIHDMPEDLKKQAEKLAGTYDPKGMVGQVMKDIERTENMMAQLNNIAK